MFCRRIGRAIEAKQAWQSNGDGTCGQNPNVSAQFTIALKDTGNVMHDAADKRIAVLFLTPYVPISQVTRERNGTSVVRGYRSGCTRRASRKIQG